MTEEQLILENIYSMLTFGTAPYKGGTTSGQRFTFTSQRVAWVQKLLEDYFERTEVTQ